MFLLPLPLSVHPLSAALSVTSVPDNPFRCSLLGYAFCRHLLEPPTPLLASTCGAVPAGPDEVLVSSPWSPAPLCRSSSSPALVLPHILCLLVFFLLMVPLLRAGERPGHIQYLVISQPTPRPITT